MDLVQDVKNILSTDVEEVISTSMSLNLLRCYSVIYLNGAQPKTCAKSQRQYYNQLKINGLEMAQKKEETTERTCVPAWKGIKYVGQVKKEGKIVFAHGHINPDTLTDKEAKRLLDLGVLKKTDFKVLPK